MIKGIDESILKKRIEDSLHNDTHVLAAGYQGKTLLFEDNGRHIVIKIPHGRGLAKYIHTLMLRHEYRVYQQLSDFDGAPSCYGLVANTYLALEFAEGHPIRNQRPADEQSYFKKLFELIQQLHHLGVAHMDLKKKDNLLVTSKDRPCLIDFGVAVIKKPGFHPLNAFLFKLAKRFDYNAWIKHKYHNNMQNLSKQDTAYYKRTLIEKISSTLKKTYLRMK